MSTAAPPTNEWTARADKLTDPRTVVGPREATDEDKALHAAAWDEFDASKPKAKSK